MKKDLFNLIKIITLGVLLSIGASYLFAWNGNTSTPTANNAAEPINISSNPQIIGTGTSTGSLLDIKGILSSTMLGIAGQATFNGNLNISGLSSTGNDTLCATSSGLIVYCP